MINAQGREVVVYSAGYQRLDFDRFAQEVEALDVFVADVRLKPVSRNSAWNKIELWRRLGDRYHWIGELGNRNYQGGPIVLQDPAVGLRKLTMLLVAKPVVVLCVCHQAAGCHRTDVIARLQRLQFGIEVRAWPIAPRADLDHRQGSMLDL